MQCLLIRGPAIQAATGNRQSGLAVNGHSVVTILHPVLIDP